MTKREDIENELYSLNSNVQSSFKKDFNEEISDFINQFLHSYNYLIKLNWDRGNKRHVIVEKFLFNAYDSLLVSTKLLLSGLLLPSGNLMRTFNESMIIALKCSSPKLNVFNEIEKNPIIYPYHKVINRLNEKKDSSILNLDKNKIRSIKEINNLYVNYSHASYFSLFRLIDRSRSKTCIGSVYDNMLKEKVYSREIEFRVISCKLLSQILSIIDNNLFN